MTRDQALAAVSGWVERIGASQDYFLSLREDAAGDAIRLAGLLEDGSQDLESLLALGWMLWYQHLALKNKEELLRWAVGSLRLRPNSRAITSGAAQKTGTCQRYNP